MVVQHVKKKTLSDSPKCLVESLGAIPVGLTPPEVVIEGSSPQFLMKDNYHAESLYSE